MAQITARPSAPAETRARAFYELTKPGIAGYVMVTAGVSAFVASKGQVPLADQLSGRSLQPYMWNMRLVGQQDIQNRGENGNLGWIGDCAYVSAYCTHSSATVRRRDTSGSTACSTAS